MTTPSPRYPQVCTVCGEEGCRCRACDRARLNRGGHGPMLAPPPHTCVLAKHPDFVCCIHMKQTQTAYKGFCDRCRASLVAKGYTFRVGVGACAPSQHERGSTYRPEPDASAPSEQVDG